MPLSQSEANFLNSIWPFAQTASQQTGIDPSVIAAQAALETGWGQHVSGGNYFGIKGSGQVANTTEYVSGSPVTEQQGFASYDGLQSSVQGWADFITGNKRYAGVSSAGAPTAQAQALAQAGYATDPNYGSKLTSLTSQISEAAGSSGGGFSFEPKRRAKLAVR